MYFVVHIINGVVILLFIYQILIQNENWQKNNQKLLDIIHFNILLREGSVHFFLLLIN